MARLTDPEILARYHQALADWAVTGAIKLEGRAHKGLRATLEGVTEEFFLEALYRFVCEAGGKIYQVKEERERWRNDWEWHYDLYPTINGVNLYVETRLYPESLSSKHPPEIRIVNIHPPEFGGA